MILTPIQLNKIIEILELDPKDNIMITPKSDGFNFRVKKREKIERDKPFIVLLGELGVAIHYCKRCTRGNYGTEKIVHLHGHHIIPKSAGGKDDKENGLVLCDKCHEGLHAGRWKVVSIIGSTLLEQLRKKYNVRYGVLND